MRKGLVVSQVLALLLAVGVVSSQAQMRRFVRFEAGADTAYGLLEGDSIQELQGGLFDPPVPTGKTHALADVKLLAPVEPRTVFCVGLNYQSHIGDRDPAAEPGIFLKTPGGRRDPVGLVPLLLALIFAVHRFDRTKTSARI